MNIEDKIYQAIEELNRVNNRKDYILEELNSNCHTYPKWSALQEQKKFFYVTIDRKDPHYKDREKSIKLEDTKLTKQYHLELYRQSDLYDSWVSSLFKLTRIKCEIHDMRRVLMDKPNYSQESKRNLIKHLIELNLY